MQMKDWKKALDAINVSMRDHEKKCGGCDAQLVPLQHRANTLKDMGRKKEAAEALLAQAGVLEKAKNGFESDLDDDFNLAGAMGHIFDLVTELNKLKLSQSQANDALDFMRSVNGILGVLELGEVAVPPEVMDLMQRREVMRRAKNWAEADNIRDKLTELGWTVEDKTTGPVARRLTRPVD